jgi:hypothetical protein
MKYAAPGILVRYPKESLSFRTGGFVLEKYMTTYLKTAVLAALTLMVPAFTQAASVSGKWRAEFDSPIGRLIYIYDLRTDGDKLTGKANRDQEGEKTETEIKEGKVSGNDVQFIETLRRDD